MIDIIFLVNGPDLNNTYAGIVSTGKLDYLRVNRNN